MSNQQSKRRRDNPAMKATATEQAQTRLDRIQQTLALVSRYPPQLGRVEQEPVKWEVGK
jgi:hypothetical protein